MADEVRDCDRVWKTGTALWEDLEHYVTYTVHERLMTFEVYRVWPEWDEDGKLLMKNGVPPLVESGPDDEPVWTTAEARVCFKGSITYCGVSTWEPHPDNKDLVFESRSELVQFGNLLTRLWDLAGKEIPTWNG
jgi:hypothetical protein